MSCGTGGGRRIVARSRPVTAATEAATGVPPFRHVYDGHVDDMPRLL